MTHCTNGKGERQTHQGHGVLYTGEYTPRTAVWMCQPCADEVIREFEAKLPALTPQFELRDLAARGL